VKYIGALRAMTELMTEDGHSHFSPPAIDSTQWNGQERRDILVRDYQLVEHFQDTYQR